jgi:NitT/TauT family transport system substrate-binding protein
MRKKSIALLMAGLLLAVLFLASCAGQPSSQPVNQPADGLQKIVVAEATRGETWLPVYLAQELGYYKEAGLDVQFVTYKDGPLAQMGLLAGEAQFCIIGFEPVLQAFEKGKETKVILTTTYNQPYMFATRKGIDKVSDLKGKVIFAGMAGSAPYYFARTVLEDAGLNPDKDVTFASLEYGAEVAALGKGDIDASYVRATKAPEFQAVGANIVVDATDPAQHTKIYGSDRYEAMVVQVTNEYIKNSPENIQKFTNSVYRAMLWQAGNTDEEVGKKVSPFFPGRNIDARLISILRRSLSPDGSFSEKGYNTVAQFCQNSGIITKPVPFAAVIDQSFIEKAQKEIKK